MNLENYRKEFSVFVFHENVAAARWQKDQLSQKGYEAYFYSSPELFMQSLYLSLPHLVILPYTQGVQELLTQIRKISREILVLITGEEDQAENVMALVERGLAYDFVFHPVKNPKGLLHRVDQAAQKWLVSLNQESAQNTLSLQGLFPDRGLSFVEDEEESSQDSFLADVVRQKSEESAVTKTLQNLQGLTGLEFAYFKHDHLADALYLSDVSFGFSANFQGLGIKYSELAGGWKALLESSLWKEFFQSVFKTEATYAVPVAGSPEAPAGWLVALSGTTPTAQQIIERFQATLGLVMDHLQKSRWIYDNNRWDLVSGVLNNKAFYEAMGMEVSRSRRLNLPVSLISFQIEGGSAHEQKRSVARLSQVLKRFTRATDHVGRVANLRLAVLFPHTSLEATTDKAARLLGIMKAALAEKSLTSVQVKAGVCSYPLHCSDSLSLIQGAEEAADFAESFEVVVYQTDESEQDAPL